MISHEPIRNNEHITIEPSDARTPQHYAPPKLEKMQKLAQVTGNIVVTGVPA